jgi:hypothetical protein
VLIKVLYVRGIFDCFKVFALLQRDVTGGDLVNREVLRVGKLSSPGIAGGSANLPGTSKSKTFARSMASRRVRSSITTSSDPEKFCQLW